MSRDDLPRPGAPDERAWRVPESFDAALEQARRRVWHAETAPMPLVDHPDEPRGRFARRRRFRIERTQQANEAVDITLRIGALFLAGGARTDDVEAALFATGTALGLEDFDVDITYNAITLSVPPVGRRPGVTALRVVRTHARHYARLAAAHVLVDDLASGRIPRDDLPARLAAVERAPRPYPRWLVTVAWGVLAASIVIRLGGDGLTAGVAFASAAAVDRIGRQLTRRRAPQFFLNAVGAFIATAVAVVMTAADVPARPSLVVAGGIIALLPGMALMVAVQEAIGRFPVTAAARLVELLVATSGIVVGVLAGLLLADQLGVTMQVADLPAGGLGSMLLAVVAGGASAAASSVGHHAPPRLLLVAGVGGLAGIAALQLVASRVSTPGAGEAVGAVVVGFIGGALARRRRLPAVLLVVPGIIAMLPGLAVYRGLLALSQGDVPAGTADLLGAATVALAVAAGVLLGEMAANVVTGGRSALVVPTRRVVERTRDVVRAAPPVRRSVLKAGEPAPTTPTPVVIPDAGAPDPDLAEAEREAEASEGGTAAADAVDRDVTDADAPDPEAPDPEAPASAGADDGLGEPGVDARE